MASSRLPGKVLLPALGQPLLSHLVNRLKAVSQVDQIVLATTTNEEDNELEVFATDIDIHCYRGSEKDVMKRVICAAESTGADVLVEITADCPIIDPQIVGQAVSIFRSNKVDYLGNTVVRSYPDGMDVQVLSLNALKRSASMTKNAVDREHVTLHIRNNPDLFSHLNLVAPPELFWPDLGLTLDEEADYELLTRIIQYFGPNQLLFSCLEVVQLLKENPDWVLINQSVERKGAT